MSPPRSISRSDLRQQLVRAAQLRASVSMLAMPLALFATAATLELLGDAAIPFARYGLLSVFGIPAVVGLLVTRSHCRKAVRCPECGTSLWSCGTGNFKPRRMRVRSDATGCPGCRAPIR